MKAIVICGMPASGKTTVARIIGKRLGIEAIGGGEILREIAKDRGYNPEGDDWWDTEEGIRFLRERAADLNFDKEADRRMIEKANRGNIIITSYTAPWIVKNAFKVWLDAHEHKRIERMAKRAGVEQKEIEHVVWLRDKENTELYDRLYKVQLGKDKKPFDLIVDTDNMKPEQVADIIMKKMQELDLLK